MGTLWIRVYALELQYKAATVDSCVLERRWEGPQQGQPQDGAGGVRDELISSMHFDC